jgi:thiol:disulfide interchange protein DsbA
MMRFLSALILAAVAPAAFAQAMVERFQQGVHYFPIEPAQATPTDTVEVTEVFSYACIHCAHFQPVVDGWKKKMPAGATFTYLPAAWNPGWEMLARAFYAAEALGVLDKTHKAFFDAIHVERRPFGGMEDIAAWFEANGGVKAADFLATANSSGVNIKVNRSKQMVPRYGVDGTPSVVVAGKYRITGGSAGGWQQVFEIVDYLVAREQAARKAG